MTAAPMDLASLKRLSLSFLLFLGLIFSQKAQSCPVTMKMSVSRQRTTPGQKFQIRVLLENRGSNAYSDLVISIKLPGDIDPVATSANPSAKMVKKTPYIQGKIVNWSKFILPKGKSQRFSVNVMINPCATQKSVAIKGEIFGNGTLPCEVVASPARVSKCDGDCCFFKK